METVKVERLAALKQQVREMQEEMKDLEGEVLDTMLAEGVLKSQTAYGTISVGKRRSYELPAWYLDQEKELKIAKKKAIKESDYAENPYLIYRSNEPKGVNLHKSIHV